MCPYQADMAGVLLAEALHKLIVRVSNLDNVKTGQRTDSQVRLIVDGLYAPDSTDLFEPLLNQLYHIVRTAQNQNVTA